MSLSASWRWLLLALSTPLLMFPTVVPLASVAVAVTIALAVSVDVWHGRPWVLPPNSIRPPLVVLMVTVAVALAVTPVAAISAQKMAGIFLGLLLLIPSFAAAGLFMSTLTAHPAVAAVSTNRE